MHVECKLIMIWIHTWTMFGGSVDEDVTAGIVPLKTEAVMDRDGII